ncbi:MAG: GAF domain-containing protein [Proteobacteria bacterium]|nr:GAF domain-containing protein [Pseudomonadota bacterium]
MPAVQTDDPQADLFTVQAQLRDLQRAIVAVRGELELAHIRREVDVQKAVADGQGFIWNQGDAVIDPTQSMRRLVIASGMYAPLLWRGEIMGVMCVDNPHHVQAFQDEDLRYLMVAAQYTAAALATHFKLAGTAR